MAAAARPGGAQLRRPARSDTPSPRLLRHRLRAGAAGGDAPEEAHHGAQRCVAAAAAAAAAAEAAAAAAAARRCVAGSVAARHHRSQLLLCEGQAGGVHPRQSVEDHRARAAAVPRRRGAQADGATRQRRYELRGLRQPRAAAHRQRAQRLEGRRAHAAGVLRPRGPREGAHEALAADQAAGGGVPAAAARADADRAGRDATDLQTNDQALPCNGRPEWLPLDRRRGRDMGFLLGQHPQLRHFRRLRPFRHDTAQRDAQ